MPNLRKERLMHLPFTCLACTTDGSLFTHSEESLMGWSVIFLDVDKSSFQNGARA
jgi:hypothetical protein